ncbi:LacI family DNA-binding transcriptional regulator [Caldalkalibacillus salinus]|uniref:LacI family DNA-binding transcriptional regulator n=1 Tax=Caldalkalibacillus salinus TaxID=2803787 RepID=UPI0019216295|nr:LacI family DNA-binding transcriptional regulator [Caldalkalibacillus salinus]
MTTINDIAKLAEVSRTTVSRVLNRNGYVSEDVRQRVLRAVEQTGYVPSAHAKSLRTKQSKVIGVIIPRINTEAASRVVNGIDEYLSEYDYQILLANTQLDADKEVEYMKLLQARQVDGIILLATNVSKTLQNVIKELKVPIVVIGQAIPGVNSVIYDDYNAAVELTKFMIEKGHKRLAFIGVNERDHAVGMLRKKGFVDTLRQYHLDVQKDWMAYGDFSIDSGYLAMKKIVTEGQGWPTAVLAVTDRMAIGGMQYLKERGVSIPHDIGVAGIGNSDMSQYVSPALTTVNYDNHKAGQKAAQTILETLNKPIGHEKDFLEKKLMINHGLIERNSL